MAFDCYIRVLCYQVGILKDNCSIGVLQSICLGSQYMCVCVNVCVSSHMPSGNGPAAPVLAGPFFLKVKMKVQFYK